MVVEIVIAIVALVLGFSVGFYLKKEDLRKKSLETEAEIERKIRLAEKNVHEMEKEAHNIVNSAKDESRQLLSEAKDEAVRLRQTLEKTEVRLEQQEKNLTEKVDELSKQKLKLVEQEEEIQKIKDQLSMTLQEEQEKLEKVAKMKQQDALDLLLQKVEETYEKDIVNKMKRSEEVLHDRLEEKSKNAIVQAIQKMASETTSEATVTAVSIPDDEMKGRVIGREGRNINAFERLTGVDVIVDDTPNIITISGYDLLRRFIAKRSLEQLVEDGRIHPTRIEEVVEKTTKEVDKMVKDFGEKAVFETGVSGLPSELIKILGRLRFRTSYGQNVLKHAIEVAFLSEAIANEVGADSELAKKAGLLHDIGKAVSQEVSGKHALISAEICRKFKLDEKIINIVEAHHEDIEMLYPEAFIVAAADAISASRPGARRETIEAFIRRVKDLENIATSFDGVEKCYAIQAGRELRVVVNPEKMSDLDAKKLSWSIARRIEEDMTYPGEIKILVLREVRSEEIAK